MTDIFSQLPCTAVSVYAGSLREQHRGVIYKRVISSAPLPPPQAGNQGLCSAVSLITEKNRVLESKGEWVLGSTLEQEFVSIPVSLYVSRVRTDPVLVTFL